MERDESMGESKSRVGSTWINTALPGKDLTDQVLSPRPWKAGKEGRHDDPSILPVVGR